MIIYGSRGIERTVTQGNFHCPRCGPSRVFTHKEIRRWFTLYFIPVFPMYRAGEYIECGTCGATFGPEVLNYSPEPSQQVSDPMMVARGAAAASGAIPFDEPDPNAVRQQMVATSRRLLVLSLAALPRPNEGHMTSLCNEFHRLVGQPLTPDQVNGEWQQVIQSGQNIVPYARQVSGQFTPQQLSAIMQAITGMIAGGRSITMEERQLASQIATALGISSTIAEQVIVPALGR
ncbi:hypothetical protein Psta_4393 [Pirellula staleyi DSM 6068]|uniref:Zinc-ribbon 15 domain-containing protein n=1 Tax=Pirellula staleyi (strain ATCC 27377 / DSM 6068 / ICPB 4128) TaxID=530564 RepID=D2R5V5_PIRSD|nr:zinc ribbon domain-containing protein [Pirellula staleyi]ADB19040.1 hypothetical protein Psta_4393 [Pirellula staleyi DSM 6068]